jgi:hypothetical protein
MIWATDATGTYGEGIYFANPLQLVPGFSPVNTGVSCPFDSSISLKVATAYNIPRVGQPPVPSLVQAYVDITFYRKGYYQFMPPQINNNGAEEIVLTQPLVPWAAPLNRSGKAVMLLPEFAQVTDWCPPFVVDAGG